MSTSVIPHSKLSASEFAAKIRAKYPGTYDHVSDEDLTSKILQKYPDYRERVKEPIPGASSHPFGTGSFMNAVVSDLSGLGKGMVEGVPGMAASALERGIEDYQWKSKGLPTPEQQHSAQQKAQGYSPFYRYVSTPLASGAGVNVEGMEDAASRGDVGGVAGHVVVPAAAAVAPVVGEGAMRAGSGISHAMPEGGIVERSPLATAPVKDIAGKAARAFSDVVDPDITGIVSPRLAHAQRIVGKIGRVIDKPSAGPVVSPEVPHTSAGPSITINDQPIAAEYPGPEPQLPEAETPWGGNTKATGKTTASGDINAEQARINKGKDVAYHQSKANEITDTPYQPPQARKGPVKPPSATAAFPEMMQPAGGGVVNPNPEFRGLGPEPKAAPESGGAPLKVAPNAPEQPFLPSEYFYRGGKQAGPVSAPSDFPPASSPEFREQAFDEVMDQRDAERAAQEHKNANLASTLQESIKQANSPVEPRWAYRSRSVGDRGIPSASRAQATLDPVRARQYMVNRGDVTGQPQEMIRTDINRLPQEQYTVQSESAMPDFVKFNSPVEEQYINPVSEEMMRELGLAPQPESLLTKRTRK